MDMESGMEPGRLRFELRSIKGWMSHPRKGWQSAFQRRKDRGEAENQLEPFFIMEGELLMLQCVRGHGVRNAGMLIWKFLPFAVF